MHLNLKTLVLLASAVMAEVAHPTFESFDAPIAPAFVEQFNEGAESRWKPSSAKKDDEFSYVGEWAFEEPTVLPGFAGDRGLVLKSPAAHHAITAKLDEPFDNTGNTLVLQYEVKLQKSLECGGAYVKLLTDNDALHKKEFSSDSSYQVMFGPDKCGSTNKIHFILRRKSPVSGEYEEKHLMTPPPARLNKLTNLYTLVIRPDQDFEIRVNGDVVKAGNLRDGDFGPSFDPPKEVIDAKDKKPKNWVDEREIPDPDQAEKPDDWDETAPKFIPDPEATKPEDWDEDLEEFIDDPEAEIPEDWDDEEDGEYVAPQILNPECQDHGCGPWNAPNIPNPDYKGKWTQPKIPNPAYKGPWSPRLIPNPDFYEDLTPSNLEPIGAIGFELWTMQNEILFDNIYLGHSVDDAETFGNATFVPKLAIELEEEAASAPPPTPKEHKRYESALDFFKDDPVGYLTEISRVFILNFSVDPKQAIINQPLPALLFGTAFLVVLAVLFGFLNVVLYGLSKAASPSQKPKQAKEVKGKETKDEAKTSSATKGTTSAKKRT